MGVGQIVYAAKTIQVNDQHLPDELLSLIGRLMLRGERWHYTEGSLHSKETPRLQGRITSFLHCIAAAAEKSERGGVTVSEEGKVRMREGGTLGVH